MLGLTLLGALIVATLIVVLAPASSPRDNATDAAVQPATTSWTSPTGPEGGSVNALVTGDDPQVVYAGTPAGVFESTTGGATWGRLSRRLDVTSVVLDPSDPRVVYAATIGSGVIRSGDHGRTWQRAGASPDNVSALAIDATDPQTLYAATLFRGVFLTTDGGQRWRLTPLRRGIVALAVDPTAPHTVHAASRASVFTSSDHGAHWDETHLSSTAWRTAGLAVDASTGTAYVSGSYGVYESTDTGRTWTFIGYGLPATQVVVPGPESSGALYAGTTSGVFRRAKGDDVWRPFGRGLGRWISVLTLDPTGRILLAAGVGGVSRYRVGP